MAHYPDFLETEEDKRIWDQDRVQLYEETWRNQIIAEEELKALLPDDLSLERLDDSRGIRWEVRRGEEVVKSSGSIHFLLCQQQEEDLQKENKK